MKTITTVSKSEYAARRGWSRPYLSKLIAEGKLTPTAEGRIDVAAADKELAGVRGTTLHGRHGRSLVAQEDSEDDSQDLRMHGLWVAYWHALRTLWRELRRGTPADRKLRRDHLLHTVRDLK